jgi:ATP-binding cassette subfamily G (WHITE) protein 2 (SNQ2)
MSEKEIYEESPKARDESPCPTNRTRNSIDTVHELEKERENVRNANPNGFVSRDEGVNVKAAEAEFAELQRELTGISEASRRLSKIQSRQSKRSAAIDEEDAENPTTEGVTFDLEATLRGNQAAEVESGIRPKHIGVIWEGLTVTGIGGVSNFVRTFPDAFVSFFNVYATAKTILGLGKQGKKIKILQDFRGVAKPGEMVLVLGRPGSVSIERAP